MAWTKCMEDNQDYFTDNMRDCRAEELRGVDINGVVFPGPRREIQRSLTKDQILYGRRGQIPRRPS